jgi:hypothetical protein
MFLNCCAVDGEAFVGREGGIRQSGFEGFRAVGKFFLVQRAMLAFYTFVEDAL